MKVKINQTTFQKMEQNKPSKLVKSFKISPISQVGTQKQLPVLDILQTWKPTYSCASVEKMDQY